MILLNKEFGQLIFLIDLPAQKKYYQLSAIGTTLCDIFFLITIVGIKMIHMIHTSPHLKTNGFSNNYQYSKFIFLAVQIFKHRY